MRVRVLFHDNCFDGAASAALFTCFHRARVVPDAEYSYRGLTHHPGEVFPPSAFDGDENVVLDFRYSRDPRLTWWFDHHVSAFPTREDEAHFRADTSGRRFYDAASPSCTQLIARVAAEKFGFDVAPHAELIDWARVIDGAQFPDAHTAVALEAPTLQLMTWVEANRDQALTERFIRDLGQRPLAAIAAEPWVTRPLEPLLEQHRRTIATVARRARREGDVVLFDLGDDGVEGFNKFIVYDLFPDARYSVGVTVSRTRAKVSVGTNPWSPWPRTHNVAAICERFGGGGHPMVGAVSLGPGDLARAREIAAEIVAELQRG
ncbi:MAG: hypothetical protein HY906_02720 [Deltaproteobacteria bacterium]|nr:hypothetical protein [Deltaproteobacteria bacterium]